MRIEPPLPMDDFMQALTVLDGFYPGITAEEIDWVLVIEDIHTQRFPRAGTLYVKEE